MRNTSLFQKSVINGQKKFYNNWPMVQMLQNFFNTPITDKQAWARPVNKDN